MPTSDDTKPSNEPTPAGQTADPENKTYLTRRSYGFSDPSDTYANQKDLFITIEYPAANQKVQFKAFLTEFSDTFTANWNKEQLLQRNDIIATYKNTTRAISIAWDVPCASMAESQRNLKETGTLMKMLYGTYTSLGQTSYPADFVGPIQSRSVPELMVLNQPPLLKVRFSNLVQEKPGKALYVVVEGFTFSPDLEAGFFDPDQQLFPKAWNLSLAGDVLHEEMLGWKVGEAGASTWRGNSNFPYMPSGAVKATTEPKATFASVQNAQELARKQERDKEEAGQAANLQAAATQEEDSLTLIDQVTARFNKIMGAS